MNFAVKASNGKFYNGKAGSEWLSANVSEAFVYSFEGALHKTALFNSWSKLNGLTFEAVRID